MFCIITPEIIWSFMLLSKKAIKEFKTIYIQKFHQDIDDKTAQEMAKKLLLLFKIVYKAPINKQSTKHD
jgi:hypothetical protein